MNDITKSLDYIRTLQKQEKAQENSDLWAAILALSLIHISEPTRRS
jgi:hypothetical protein